MTTISPDSSVASVLITTKDMEDRYPLHGVFAFYFSLFSSIMTSFYSTTFRSYATFPRRSHCFAEEFLESFESTVGKAKPTVVSDHTMKHRGALHIRSGMFGKQ